MMASKIYTNSDRALARNTQPAPLLTVEKAREFLAQSKNVDEVRDVADKAKAVALYLRSRNASIESQNDAAEIRLRAERRLGELTKELEKASPPGRPGSKSASRGKTQALKDLDITTQNASKWQKLAEIPERKFDKLIAETRAKGERITTSAPLKLVRNDAKAELAAQLRKKPIPLAAGRFDVIVSDPPWMYEKRATDVTQRGQMPYPPMTTEEICALPVVERAERNCILWLWTTNAFLLRDAPRVLDAWGFQEKTVMTWVKDRMGTGDWLRGKTEHCILAVRGKPTIQLTNQTTELRGVVREHSRKPESFYDLVEALCPGTKLEMFAREPREGWARWGAESELFAKGAA